MHRSCEGASQRVLLESGRARKYRMCQAGEQQVQRPGLSQGTEGVPEKQSRHIKGEGRGGWRRDQTGGKLASAPHATGSIRSRKEGQHGCRADVGNRAEEEEPPKRPG